ncbi:MAG: iron ABC transporter permease [Clostridia bacterium]|nr:iron ABC transporter permease [Clostridia bacterium]
MLKLRDAATGIKIIISLIVLVVVMLISCCLGSVRIPIPDIIKTLTNSEEISKATRTIILQVRFPRIIMSALIGGSLASIGAVMQGLFKNPMADASVLGISSGSALGATIMMVSGVSFSVFGITGNYLGAIVGAVVTWLIVYNIARISGDYDLNTTLLAGIAISSIFTAIITVIMTMNKDRLEQIYLWMLGTFSNSTPSKTLIMSIVVLILMPILIIIAPRIDVLKLGKEAAKGLGVSSSSSSAILLTVSSILLAFCVANSGIIGFIGLIIPHCVSFMRVYKMRSKLIMSFLVGAIFTVICDTIAKTVAAPGEIAIGAITSLIGAPYFLYLMLTGLRRERKMR